MSLVIGGCSTSSSTMNKPPPAPVTRAVSPGPSRSSETAAGLGTVLQQLAGELIGERSEPPESDRPAPGLKKREGIGLDGADTRQAKKSGGPDAALRDQPTAQTAECQRALEDFQLARNSKDMEDSIFYYRRGLRLCPNDEIGRNELGELYLKIHQYDEATQEFKRVIEINPESERGRKNLEAARARR